MIIIAAKNAFLRQRTGVEEYTFQLIKYLRQEKTEEIIIYTNRVEIEVNFPSNFHLKIIHLPILWTHIGLSLKILEAKFQRKFRNLVLFIPAHVMPLIHPKHTVVTIHGLEYEYFPKYYSWFARHYLRFSTRYATQHAWKIIAVSKNTKRDLIKLYGCDPSKIKVIYHGIERVEDKKSKTKNKKHKLKIKNKIITSPYFLSLGRVELKKNITGIIKAFEIFKRNYELRIMNNEARSQKPYAISYKLILAGPPGYGSKKIKDKILKIKNELKQDIILTGYVNGKRKWALLRNAEALVFPSYYEGFGLPILEAQSVGVPVITSSNSSTEEITDMKFPISNFQFSNKSQIPNSKSKTINFESALLVNPNKPAEIAEAMYQIVSDKKLRDELIRRGYKNVKRFSWQKTAQETLETLNS